MSCASGDSLVDRARLQSTRNRRRLTQKRQRVLELLLASPAPMSAYDIVDAYKKRVGSPIRAMTVYRILAFLESAMLVHKLNATHQYVAYSQRGEVRDGNELHFLVCRRCFAVKEITVAISTIEQIKQVAARAGYQRVKIPLELQCLCRRCQGELGYRE